MVSDLTLTHRQAHFTNSILTVNSGQQTFNQNQKPTTFADDSAVIDWSYQRDLILTKADFSAHHFDYDSSTQANGALTIESNFNHWEYDAHVRGGYEAFEGTVLYIEPGLSLRRYDRSPTDFPQLGTGAEDRNSNGGQLLVGVTYNASAVTYLDFGIGYLQRDFRDPTLPRARGLTARGALTWNPTDLITVGASLTRDVVETTTLGIAGFFRTEGKLSFDYEWRYNVILQSSIDYAREDPIARAGFAETITDLRTEIAGLYLINEYAKARVGYRYESLVNSAANLSFRENQIFLRLDLFY
jgi:hypothetical protein